MRRESLHDRFQGYSDEHNSHRSWYFRLSGLELARLQTCILVRPMLTWSHSQLWYDRCQSHTSSTVAVTCSHSIYIQHLLNREDRTQLLKSLFSGVSQTAETPQTGSFCLLSLSRQILRQQECRCSSFRSPEPQKLVQQAAQPSVYVLSLLWHTHTGDCLRASSVWLTAELVLIVTETRMWRKLFL